MDERAWTEIENASAEDIGKIAVGYASEAPLAIEPTLDDALARASELAGERLSADDLDTSDPNAWTNESLIAMRICDS